MRTGREVQGFNIPYDSGDAVMGIEDVRFTFKMLPMDLDRGAPAAAAGTAGVLRCACRCIPPPLSVPTLRCMLCSLCAAYVLLGYPAVERPSFLRANASEDMRAQLSGLIHQSGLVMAVDPCRCVRSLPVLPALPACLQQSRQHLCSPHLRRPALTPAAGRRCSCTFGA